MNAIGDERARRALKMPRNEEELLDDVEACAKLGVERGLNDLRDDVLDAFGVAPRVRRHPYVALGLGASAGALLAYDLRFGATARTGRLLRPLWAGLRAFVALASMEAARRIDATLLATVIRPRSLFAFLRPTRPRRES